MKKFLITALLIFFSFSVNVFSQKIWTLEDCIAHALENNIQIKQQQLSTAVSKLQYHQSIAALFPSVNASASHVYNNGQTVDMYTNTFASQTVQSNNFYLSSNVVLFSGLQLLNGLKQKQFDFLASQYDLEKMKNDISLTIATAYLQILYNIELLETSKSQFEISQQQLERTKTLFSVGTVANGALLQMEAQAAMDELQVVTAQNQLDLAYLSLAQFLDLMTAQGFDIEKPVLSMPDANSLMQQVDEIYNKACALQPDIRSAELKVQSAKKGLQISWGMMSPTISLSGSYGTGYSGASKKISDISVSGFETIGATGSGELVYAPTYQYTYDNVKFWDQIDQNQNKSLGLYMNIPIFNKWQTNTMIGTSKINVTNAELTLQHTKNQLFKTIQQAYADARAALNKYNASLKSVDALTESFSYTQKKFDVGMVNSLDYNDAKNKLTKATSELLQAKYEYVFRIKVLDFYQGKPLTLK
ncbi:MAG TPA: TolC family protein [Bacteroidales bacterium]|nr:TolC family protein [Bacteroidales bacterium]